MTAAPKRKKALALPRGITVGKRSDGREKPYYVRFGPNRTVESFATEKERDERVENLVKAVSTEGRKVLDFDPVEWRALQEFKRRTGVTLDEAERIILQVRGNLRLNLTVEEAVQKYRELREAEHLSKDSISHTKLHLGRFVEQAGHLPLFSITPDKIRTWLELVKVKYKLGPIALRHHRKSVHVFFERALLEKWCLENPTKAVMPPKVPAVETKVLSAKEIFDLFKANIDEPVIGKIALELWGFLRCSSVERIKESDIRWEAKGIIMHGLKQDEETGEMEQGHKSGRRKYRQRHRQILWDWLKHATPKMWMEVTPKNYDDKKAEAFIRAKVENSGNVLRHSCASYELALSHDMAHVSYMMQHRSLSMTERYEGVVEESDAKLVMAMTPDAVRAHTWESFIESLKTG